VAVLHPVRGQVFVRNQPASGALVILHPTAVGAARVLAKVQADGSFSVYTRSANDGAAPGEYAVTLVWLVKQRANEFGDEDEVDALAGRYANPAQPVTRVTVVVGPNEIPPIRLP
jgi:hypothetical protein